MSGINLTWLPPGPVAAKFMASTAQIEIINGPIGSGKTTAALMKCVFLGQAQAPAIGQTISRQGGGVGPVRRFKLCVVRDTYRQLWKTTIPSWHKRVPRTVGTWDGASNGPATHRILFALRDGSTLDFQVDFVAIGDNSAEDVLRGYEVTAFYLNELDLLARDVFEYAQSRTGRFPDMSEGGPTWHGLICDCNAPELSSWVFEDIFDKTPAELTAIGIELFRQPSGLSVDAENLPNLPPGYYATQPKADWFQARMVRNVPGYSRAGKPVYTEFNDTLHVRDVEPARGIPVQIGLDAGLTPAAVLGQQMPNGTWHILDELVTEHTGPIRFAAGLVRLLKEPRYEGVTVSRCYADPSAAFGADKEGGESTWIELVEQHSGLLVQAAPTNLLIPRLEAVRAPLTRLVDGQPGFVLSPRCKMLRKGLNAGYRFKKHVTGSVERYDEVPEKNADSHPQDAMQYLLSGGGGDVEIHQRKEARQAVARRRSAALHDWDPLSQGAR